MGEGDSPANISASTFADNTVGSAMFRLNGYYTNVPFSLKRSLVHQPGVPLISISTGSIPSGKVQYVIANDLTGVPTETGAGGLPLNLVGVPSFVDAANGNYFLAAGAEGVDYAPPEPTDLTRDGGARNIDTAAAGASAPRISVRTSVPPARPPSIPTRRTAKSAWPTVIRSRRTPTPCASRSTPTACRRAWAWIPTPA
jgi:hypothetical protein